VQRSEAHGGKPAGSIAWSEHVDAWKGYRDRFPSSAQRQDAARIAERHGFSYCELVEYLGREPTTWEPR